MGAGGHDIIFSNSPTIVSGATPLRDAVLFDGINQFGVVATPATNQPFTIYVVMRSVGYTVGRRVFDDGVVIARKRLLQSPSSPTLRASAPTGLDSFPSLAIGTYGVMTIVYNGVSSEIRTNLNAANTGNIGANNGNGITIGAATGGAAPTNVEMGYFIIRDGADSIAIQNSIIGGLEAICGLTF